MYVYYLLFPIRPNIEPTSEQSLICDELSEYITENRLNNVISKLSLLDQNFLNIIRLFNVDILEDYKKEGKTANLFNLLSKKEQKIITKQMNNISNELVKKYTDEKSYIQITRRKLMIVRL